jgi:hypothetical protein
LCLWLTEVVGGVIAHLPLLLNFFYATLALTGVRKRKIVFGLRTFRSRYGLGT